MFTELGQVILNENSKLEKTVQELAQHLQEQVSETQNMENVRRLRCQ